MHELGGLQGVVWGTGDGTRGPGPLSPALLAVLFTGRASRLPSACPCTGWLCRRPSCLSVLGHWDHRRAPGQAGLGLPPAQGPVAGAAPVLTLRLSSDRRALRPRTERPGPGSGSGGREPSGLEGKARSEGGRRGRGRESSRSPRSLFLSADKGRPCLCGREATGRGSRRQSGLRVRPAGGRCAFLKGPGAGRRSSPLTMAVQMPSRALISPVCGREGGFPAQARRDRQETPLAAITETPPGSGGAAPGTAVRPLRRRFPAGALGEGPKRSPFPPQKVRPRPHRLLSVGGGPEGRPR